MAYLNLCQFIGNAGDAPKVRAFDNGNKIAQVRIAVTERYIDRNNVQQSVTDWIPLVFNGKLADIAAQYIAKGSAIYVAGKWKNREWTDQSGAKHIETELRVDVLQLLSPRPQAQQQPAAQGAPAPQYPAAGPQYQQAPPQPSYPGAPGYAPAQAPAPQYPPQAQPTYQPAQPAGQPTYQPAPQYPAAPAQQPQAPQAPPAPQGQQGTLYPPQGEQPADGGPVDDLPFGQRPGVSQ